MVTLSLGVYRCICTSCLQTVLTYGSLLILEPTVSTSRTQIRVDLDYNCQSIRFSNPQESSHYIDLVTTVPYLIQNPDQKFRVVISCTIMIYCRLEFISDKIVLRMFKTAKNTIAKNFTGYIVIIIVMNFPKKFSIANIFPSRFSGVFANMFQHKIIRVYSIKIET